jgi:hypothetical protein
VDALSVDKLIALVLYVTPGFIALELYRSVYPVKERSDFIQTIWSVIFGVVIFSFVRWLDKNFLNNWLRSSTTTFPNFRLIVALLVAGLAAGGARILLHILRLRLSNRFKQLKFLAPDPQSIWAKINQASNKDYAIVFLDDGVVYIGWISSYTYNPNSVDQDFLLANAKRVDGDTLNEKYLVTGIGVYLNTKNVKRIEYVKGKVPAKSTPEMKPRRSWLRNTSIRPIASRGKK